MWQRIPPTPFRLAGTAFFLGATSIVTVGAAVAAIESLPGHTFGFAVRRPAIWVVPTSGASVETPLQRGRSWWAQDAACIALSPNAYEDALRVLARAAYDAGRPVTSG